jgi:hypothetical protein
MFPVTERDEYVTVKYWSWQISSPELYLILRTSLVFVFTHYKEISVTAKAMHNQKMFLFRIR